jgi:hypothetical protein
MKCLAFVVVSVALAACGPSITNGGGPDGGDPHGNCTGGVPARCNGQTYQTCTGGHWTDQQTCNSPDICAPTIGCAACDPQLQRTCVGDGSYTCNADGTIGPEVQMCGFEMCQGGYCQGTDPCSDAAKLIYVVDDAYNLYSFNPAMNMNTFTLIGALSCPAGPSWPAWGGMGAATPFSMSVDRSATAWVVYTSGEIFHVSTTDASCQPTSFVAGTNGYQLFGMGFSSDTPGATTEQLFISGGDASNLAAGNLGDLDPTTLQISTKGPLPQEENSPELTGTGNAELFAYFPGTQVSTSFISQLDRNTGALTGTKWNVPPLSGQVYAWAFAQWGGRYYVFVTDTDPLDPTGAKNSKVILVDPMTNTATEILHNLPYYIVGAGVSTCAPVTVG